MNIRAEKSNERFTGFELYYSDTLVENDNDNFKGEKIMNNYRKLEIYNLSHGLTIEVHKLTLALPGYEMYEEGSQLRRSSKSVTSNIAEVYGRRKYKADFIKFLIYSHSSNDETILHLNFIKDIHQNLESDISELITKYNLLGRKINRYMQYVIENWK